MQITNIINRNNFRVSFWNSNLEITPNTRCLEKTLFETILEVSMDMSDKACHLFVARSNDGDKKTRIK